MVLETDVEAERPKARGRRGRLVETLISPRVRLVLFGAVLVAASGGVILVGGPSGRSVARVVEDGGLAGPLVYVALYAVLTMLLFPRAVVTAVGGALFGAVLATTLTVVGGPFVRNVRRAPRNRLRQPSTGAASAPKAKPSGSRRARWCAEGERIERGEGSDLTGSLGRISEPRRAGRGAGEEAPARDLVDALDGATLGQRTSPKPTAHRSSTRPLIWRRRTGLLSPNAL